MPFTRLAIVLLGAVMAAALAGCGARGSAAASAPATATVEQAVALLEAKRFAQIEDLACAARSDELRARFDIRPDIAAALPPELTVDQALGALTVDVETLDLSETSRLGDHATVRLSAIIRVAADRAELAQLIGEVARERGQPLADSIASGLADAVANALRARHDLATDLYLRLEDGAWRFCW